jgi:class 3 adenylate cyclase
MAWDEQQAKQRVDDHDFRDVDVVVADLSKTMDFANLGTKDVRRVDGVHIYADVRNFHAAVADAGADKQKQRKLVRAASVLRRVQGDLLESDKVVGKNEVGKIQLQAAKLHALAFKPYDDSSGRARTAVVCAITLNSYLHDVFNQVFDDVRDFGGAAGLASGLTLVANLGFRGERERICLGTPANLAAKILAGRDTISVTEDLLVSLPAEVAEHFSPAGDVNGTKVHRAQGLSWSRHEGLAETLGVDWDAASWKRRTEEYRDDLPLDDVDVVEAETLIDIDALAERSCKRTEAIAIYADLDGFTKYVQAAENDEAIVTVVRDLHMIRHEFHAVVDQDFPGLVLQHQGDRVFAIVHEPCGDDDREQGRRRRRAIDLAIGLQSSMERVLVKKIGRSGLHVAIGLDVGRVLVTRLGKKGKREVVCLGPHVTAAEQLQLISGAEEIRISESVYDALQDEILRAQFAKQKDGSYLAKGLTFPKLDELREEDAATKGTLGAVVTAGRVQVITRNANQTRPWSR